MSQKIKNFVLAALISLGMSVPALVPAVASAAVIKGAAHVAVIDNNITKGACDGANGAAGGGVAGCSADGSTDSLKTLAGKLVNVFSIVVGIAAVVMIIFGGFKYITSGGDSNNVSGAKNTLIYAIVGLIVVALAQFIVHYVLSTATNSLTQ